MNSSLVKTPVRPVDEIPLSITEPTANLPALAKRHPVEVGNNQARVEVREVAAHDGALAEALHARLDFSKVVNNGCTVTAADAYAVLAPNEFARFEVIAAALKSVKKTQSVFNAFAWATGAATAMGVTSLALYSSVPFVGQAFCDLVGAVFAVLIVAATADGVGKTKQEMLATIPKKLAALPGGQKETPADETQPAKAD